jgi:hypothetical protein
MAMAHLDGWASAVAARAGTALAAGYASILEVNAASFASPPGRKLSFVAQAPPLSGCFRPLPFLSLRQAPPLSFGVPVQLLSWQAPPLSFVDAGPSPFIAGPSPFVCCVSAPPFLA